MLLPVNHMFPSGPAAMYHGFMIEISPFEYSRMSPSVVMRPIRPGDLDSVNQSAPSGPAAMPSGPELIVRPSLNSVDVALGGDPADAARIGVHREPEVACRAP